MLADVRPPDRAGKHITTPSRHNGRRHRIRVSLLAMIADLHCHTTASDGALTPRELLHRAATAGVELLAITDHDTVDAYAELGDAGVPGLRIVPGIEFSSQWSGHTIHVVGLGIDLDSPILGDAVRRQKSAREQRAVAIGERLDRLGCNDTLAGARRLAGDMPLGRPHFARHLVESGRVKSISAAFKKYLGPGKPGDVKHYWQPVAMIIGWIRDAGGIAVLAHPGKYGMTNTKVGVLVDAFRASGGQAMEVLCGQQTADVTRRLARICNERDMHASCGSDFHMPDRSWCEIGRCGELPDDCRPVWELL